jgi:integrase
MGTSEELHIFGEPMKRGSLLCGRCSSRRGEKERSCPNCGHDTVYIRIKIKGVRHTFWYDTHGLPLSHSQGLQLLYKINQDKHFRPENYKRSSIQEALFENVVQRWLTEKEDLIKKGDFAPGTLHPYQAYTRNYFLPFFKGQSVQEINEADIKRFKKQLPATISSHYRSNIYRALKTFFIWLKAGGQIIDIPPFEKAPKPVSRKLQPLAYEDQQQAIDRLPKWHQDLFRFCSEAALRMGEACALQVGDIDIKRGKAIIQRAYSYGKLRDITKGRTPREATLSDIALEIAQRKVKGKLPGARLFTLENGKGYNPEYMRKIWTRHSETKSSCEEAMRHSTLTDLANLGANAYQIQEIAGHSDIRTSQAYVKSSEARLKDMVNLRAKR